MLRSGSGRVHGVEEIDDEPSNGVRGRPAPALAPRARGEGGAAAVACASAMPLIVLAVAVAADYVNVARFTTRVQLAADAAAAAVSGTIARNPNVDGRDVDEIAERIAAFVFARNAPRGAGGTPTVATTSRASVVTTTVGYQGVAPSNFGSALGYGAISVKASATSLAARRRFPSDPRPLRAERTPAPLSPATEGTLPDALCGAGRG